MTAPNLADHFPAPGVVGHDDRRPAEQRFQGHQPEDFIVGRIDDDRGRGERFEPLATAQQSSKDHSVGQPIGVNRCAGLGQRAHVVAGYDQTRRRVSSSAERVHQKIDTLTGCQLAQKKHQGGVPLTDSCAKPPTVNRLGELVQVDRIRDDVNLVVGHAQLDQLTAFCP